VYLLNPFSYALERQLVVVAGVLTLPIGGLLLARIGGYRLSLALQAIRRWFGLLVVMSLGATTALYGFAGPAAGSEALKLSVCLFAGLVTAGYARQTFLARKVLPDLFSLRSIVESLGGVFASSPEPRARAAIHASLFRAYLGLLALGLGTLAAAALVFSDFGGTLVSAVVFTALIFILFGLRLALFFLLVGGLAGSLALLTDKVQSRIQLMLDPMTASVSDFARLIKFSEAAQPHGFGLGTVRWCSFEGACLPIQALSDYFPVLLSGALGAYGALTIFFVLIAIYIGLMARAVVGFASGLGTVSVVYAVSFFLLLAALSQTVITYFGNWRLVPLTGLGLPLMSLGWSSMIAVTLGLSLLAIALRLTPRSPGIGGI
jgi:cell division protein FtsW (lipid II flippase)